MPLTIGEARRLALEHLDDENGERYARKTGSNTTSWSKIDRALRSAQSRCIDDYVGRGGDRFDEQVDVTTSSDGTVNIDEYGNPFIRGVLIRPSDTGSFWPIEPGDKLQRIDPDNEERNLRVTIVRRFEIPDPADEDDLLMGTVQGAARSWDAFDNWVVARAALQLGIKDDEMRRALVATIADLQQSVFGHRRNPPATPWPQATASWRVAWWGQLRWTYLEREQTIALYYGVG